MSEQAITRHDPRAAATPFPAGFRWGVATSAYQVEGGVEEDGRGPSIWDTFAHTPGRVRDGRSGDVACDHYHRWRDDLALLAWLGVDAYRFSIAWPRVLPDGAGPVHTRGLDFYDRLVDALLEAGIEPFATLYHWDLPQALEDDGGWSNRATADHFAGYAAAVVERLGDRVRHWTTMNEPWCSAFLGYDVGAHAPGVRDPRRAVAAAHHLLLGHARALQAIRDRARLAPEVGIVLNVNPVDPATATPADRAAADAVDGTRNRLWLDALLRGRYPEDVLASWEGLVPDGLIRARDLDEIGSPIDVLGVNYYAPQVIVSGGNGRVPGPGHPDAAEARLDVPTTTMGWPMVPDGLTRILTRIRSEYGPVPVYVTENGAAFDDTVGPGGSVRDDDRIGFLAEHLAAAASALEAGVDLRGYFVWSLLDNFEWDRGYTQRFGIVHVDFATLEREPKASAHWYRDLIDAHRDRGTSP